MIQLFSKNKTLSSTVELPLSKSITNRCLIIEALTETTHFKEISDANDSQLLKKLLRERRAVYDCEDAGTSLRFLLSYLALENRNAVITGSKRMCERPIDDLVNALRQIGFRIDYLDKTGYPPLEISARSDLNSLNNQVIVRAEKSSQFLSSLLLIAPKLPQGLDIQVDGVINSRPYIDMTLALMKEFSIAFTETKKRFKIPPQSYQLKPYQIEADWSNAAYFYTFLCLSESKSLVIHKLSKESIQGDRISVDIMEQFGIKTTFQNNRILLEKEQRSIRHFEYNFSHCPDLAQTLIVLCAALGLDGTFSGLASLRIKESDRISALETELKKISVHLTEQGKDQFNLDSSKLTIPKKLSIKTYKDHRMAMAFAPLCFKTQLCFDDESVVKKSFPNFWEELKKQDINCEYSE